MALLYGATASDGWRFAEAFRAAVATQGFPGESSQPLGRMTVSGGVATFPLDAQDDIALIKAADDAPLPRQGRRPQLHGRPGDRGPVRRSGGAPGPRRRWPSRTARSGGGLGDPGRRDRPRDRAGHSRQRPLRRAAPVRPAEGRPGVRGRDRAPRGRPPREGRGARRSRSEPTAVRKLPGIAPLPVALGGDAARTTRLWLRDGPVEVVATGDPAEAPAGPRAARVACSPTSCASTTRACARTRPPATR